MSELHDQEIEDNAKFDINVLHPMNSLATFVSFIAFVVWGKPSIPPPPLSCSFSLFPWLLPSPLTLHENKKQSFEEPTTSPLRPQSLPWSFLLLPPPPLPPSV
jgi:hypothetical protein